MNHTESEVIEATTPLIQSLLYASFQDLYHKFLRVVHPRKENNYIDWVGMLIDGSTAGRMICSESGDALDLNPGVQWQCCHLIG